jgi:hypothetical protein
MLGGRGTQRTKSRAAARIQIIEHAQIDLHGGALAVTADVDRVFLRPGTRGGGENRENAGRGEQRVGATSGWGESAPAVKRRGGKATELHGAVGPPRRVKQRGNTSPSGH